MTRPLLTASVWPTPCWLHPLARQVSKLPLPGEAPEGQQQLLGLAAVGADWATGQPLPLPLLCSLTPQGDAALALLHEQPQQQAVGAGAAAAPLLLPAAAAGAGSGDEDEQAQRAQQQAAGAPPAGPLPYVRGVPPALVAAVAAGELR